MKTLSIGKTFRQLRIKRNLTKRELASMSGIARYAINDLESDIKLARIDTLIKLADFFGVDLFDVYSGDIKFFSVLPELPKKIRHDSIIKKEDKFNKKITMIIKKYKIKGL